MADLILVVEPGLFNDNKHQLKVADLLDGLLYSSPAAIKAESWWRLGPGGSLKTLVGGTGGLGRDVGRTATLLGIVP